PPGGRQSFHAPEAALELAVRLAQRLLGIDVELQAPVGHGEKQVADFLRESLGAARTARAGQRFLDLAHLLQHLVADLRGVLPVKPDPRGAASEFRRPGERRQRARHIGKRAAIGGRSVAGGLGALARLLLLPDARKLTRIGGNPWFLEYVRVAADELFADA